MNQNVKLVLFQTVEQGNDHCAFTFRSLNEARKVCGGADPDPKYYKKVYEETTAEAPENSDEDILDRLYSKLNRDNRPGAKAFRSMSMSDVTALTRPGAGTRYYYCDTFGFGEISFDPSKTRS